MEEVTKKADQEDVWCYLESSRSEPNMAIYEKFGFKLAKEMECKDDDVEGDEGLCKLYCMLREPKSAKDATATATTGKSDNSTGL